MKENYKAYFCINIRVKITIVENDHQKNTFHPMYFYKQNSKNENGCGQSPLVNVKLFLKFKKYTYVIEDKYTVI